MPFDLHALVSGLPEDRRYGAVELARRIVEIRNTVGTTERDYPALVRVFEEYLEKYSIQTGYEPKQGDETWIKQIYHIEKLMEVYKSELDAESVADEARTLFDQYEGVERNARPFGYAFLDLDEKRRIHASLISIREIVEASKLDIRKKRAIYERLNKLAAEVDKDGTRTDAFFSFGIDISMVAREMEENARPAIEQVKDILKIIFRRRAENEGAELPSPNDIPLLPPSGD